MATKRRHHSWIVIRNGIRQWLEPAADSWVQTKFLGGIILLAGVISLVLTSNLRPAGGGVITNTRPAVGGDVVGHAEQTDCGARHIDRADGAEIASAR
jgi:hypothetical protein